MYMAAGIPVGAVGALRTSESFPHINRQAIALWRKIIEGMGQALTDVQRKVNLPDSRESFNNASRI